MQVDPRKHNLRSLSSMIQQSLLHLEIKSVFSSGKVEKSNSQKSYGWTLGTVGTCVRSSRSFIFLFIFFICGMVKFPSVECKMDGTF